jgi:CRISPR-associated protein Cmr4
MSPESNLEIMSHKSKILYLFTRTPLHVGAGASVGAIDQPIIRERHTGHPVIPGSSIKGVLRDACRNDDLQNQVDLLFGKQEDAGKLSFGEGKLLGFPVRSARGSFAIVTCPLALERFNREHGGLKLGSVEELPDMTCLAGPAVIITRANEVGVVLEEYRFDQKGPFPADWEKALLGLFDDSVWQIAKGRFVLLSNGDFSHFVRNANEVSQHVAIDPSKGTAKLGALFNLEAVPAETLFYAPVTAVPRSNGKPGDPEAWLGALEALIKRKPVLQFGGDSTTGLGFCTVRLGAA